MVPNVDILAGVSLVKSCPQWAPNAWHMWAWLKAALIAPRALTYYVGSVEVVFTGLRKLTMLPHVGSAETRNYSTLCSLNVSILAHSGSSITVPEALTLWHMCVQPKAVFLVPGI